MGKLKLLELELVPKAFGRKLEVGGWKLEVGGWRLEESS